MDFASGNQAPTGRAQGEQVAALTTAPASTISTIAAIVSKDTLSTDPVQATTASVASSEAPQPLQLPQLLQHVQQPTLPAANANTGVNSNTNAITNININANTNASTNGNAGLTPPAVTVASDHLPVSVPVSPPVAAAVAQIAPPLGPPPVIYGAVYSNIPVYEMMCNGVALMRRRADSYFNVTQVLKVAGLDKLQRQRIIDNEAPASERVLGGYGKYQGTWLPYEDSIALARKYGAELLIKPLVDFKPPQASAQTIGQSKQPTATSSRPQSQASNNHSAGRSQANTSKSTVSIPAKRKEVEPPEQKSSKAVSRPKRVARPARLVEDSDSSFNSADDDDDDGDPQQNVSGISATISLTTTSRQTATRMTKRPRQTVNDTDEEASGAEPFTTINTVQKQYSPMEIQRQLLLAIFVSTDATRNSIPDFITQQKPADCNIAIDDAGHTALHWAATLARIPLVKALIATKMCTPDCTNALGETALTRAVLASNNFDAQTFSALLQALGPACVAKQDTRSRSVLHHIALVVTARGHAVAARHYCECVLDYIAKTHGAPKAVGLDLKGVLDLRDCNGDTAINIASRLGSRVLVEMLVEAGADYNIANMSGLRPIDFGMEEACKPIKPAVVPVIVAAGASGAGGLLSLSESDLILEKASNLSTDIQKLLESLNTSFAKEVKTKQLHVIAKQKQIESLAQELTEHVRTNQALRVQNGRLPDLSAKLQAVESILKSEVEKQAHDSRVSMESDLKKIKNNDGTKNVIMDIESDGVYVGGNGDTHQDPDVLREQVQILRTHIMRQETECKKLEQTVSEIRRRDAEHQMNYKNVISMCCNIPVEQITPEMLAALLQAVESEENGSGMSLLLDGISGVRGNGNIENTTGLSVDTGLPNSEEFNDVLDGLLFKAAAL